MKNPILSAVVVIFAASTSGCHSDDDTDQLMDPLSAVETCDAGFKHSSNLQTLEVKNASSKAMRIIDMTGIDDGNPRLGTDSEKFISVLAGQSHNFNFFIDSFGNGGSIVYQADESGKRTITLDPICVETFQVPVYVRQSEGDDSWMVIALGNSPAQVLHIALDDAWASLKAPAKSHTLTIDDATFTSKASSDSLDEGFRLKP